jgi:2-oxo-4-hydroxy-4-carboxy--5-ureidoimidazoline (OHCU) decarboxylase
VEEPRIPDIAVLDRMPAAEFARVVGPLFEGAPALSARLASERPFGSFDRLLSAAHRLALAMPEAEKVELLDAHPRLGASPEGMSDLSRAEQAAGATPADDGTATAAELARLNDEYEARFGFRFVVFVAGRPRSALVPEMRAALARTREAELRRALHDVVAIAGARLSALRATPAESGPTIRA